MKKAFSLFLAVFLLSVVMTSALASGCAEIRTDPFMRYLESVSIETLLSAEEQAELLQTYGKEFAYLQQKYGEPIQTVSESVIGRIKAGAVSFAGSDAYAFDALLEQISALRFQKAVAAFNSGSNDASAQSRVNPMRAHPDQLEVRNAVRTTVVPYGALKAKHDIDVAVGLTETQTDTANVGVEVNEMLKGYKISSSVSESVSRSIAGPADNTQVRAGVYATHRAGYAVLFGRIERYTYDLYYTYTGELHSHNEIISVRDQDAIYYTFLVSYGAPTYLRHTRYTTSYSFSSRQACLNAVCSNPNTYIN